ASGQGRTGPRRGWPRGAARSGRPRFGPGMAEPRLRGGLQCPTARQWAAATGAAARSSPGGWPRRGSRSCRIPVEKTAEGTAYRRRRVPDEQSQGPPRPSVSPEGSCLRASIARDGVCQRQSLGAEPSFELLQAPVLCVAPAEVVRSVAGVRGPTDRLPDEDLVGPQVPVGGVGGQPLQDHGPVPRKQDRRGQWVPRRRFGHRPQATSCLDHVLSDRTNEATWLNRDALSPARAHLKLVEDAQVLERPAEPNADPAFRDPDVAATPLSNPLPQALDPTVQRQHVA